MRSTQKRSPFLPFNRSPKAPWLRSVACASSLLPRAPTPSSHRFTEQKGRCWVVRSELRAQNVCLPRVLYARAISRLLHDRRSEARGC